MSCKTQTKQIGDNDYSVTQWPAEKAILTKFKLVKIFGASLVSLVKISDDKNAIVDEAKLLSESLSTLFEHNSPEEITSLIKNCVIGVGCNDKRITESSFNELFSGDSLLEVYQVFIFVLKVNYGALMNGQWADNLLAKVKNQL